MNDLQDDEWIDARKSGTAMKEANLDYGTYIAMHIPAAATIHT